MPNPNAIVGVVNRVEPPVGEAVAELLAKRPEGIAIHLEGDRQARISTPEKAARLLDVIEGARVARLPLFVEVEPETHEIERISVPLQVTVVSVEEADKPELEVELAISHARHTLKRANPDFEELAATLRAACKDQSILLVTETEDHEIIDARAYPSARAGRLPLMEQLETRKSWFCRWFGWLCCFFAWLRCVSRRGANDLFDMVAATSCAPLTVPPPCIPFLYPDDGCWGRAHEMCRLMIAAGARPRKVWIYGSLNVQTVNNPNCQVFWGWHVAPTLCVRRGFCRTEEVVIDPSLFTEPVTKATWKSVQGDPAAALIASSAAIFYRNQSGSYQVTDPTYTQTNTVLATYRLALQNRALALGPPPYPCP